MSRITKIFLFFIVLAFLVAASRFVPAVGIPLDAADFAGGVGIGLLIGVVIIWASERGSHD
ncbi:MAG: hypothetical protein JO093_17940 [Acidobacteria bacterium]|nr:hypothetical protein [Acidobacteriota bacterium]MBV9069059.1 hypothetical protein [Acidobacteriota bacterium]MBV9187503.1 hypothetical protein [Acidobacteriota bacterium]